MVAAVITLSNTETLMSTPETKKRKADQLTTAAPAADQTAKESSEPPKKRQKKDEDGNDKDFNDNYSGMLTPFNNTMRRQMC